MADTVYVNIDYGKIANIVASVGVELEHKIDYEVGKVQAEVGKVQADLQTTRNDVQQLQKRFIDYVEQYERTVKVQRAETVKGNLSAEIDRTWGHYRVVRRISIGILQALDIGNVGDDTIRNFSEEQMLQAHGYWLAPAVVALASWTRGDKEAMERSVAEAFRRDQAKTALFFAIILRREGRMDAAVAWLKVYFLSLDPRSLGREFAVLLESITTNAFGAVGVNFAGEQLQEWNTLLRQDEELMDEQVQRWQKAIAARSSVPDTKHYRELITLSPDWPELKHQLQKANGMYTFKKDLEDLAEKPVVLNTNLVEMLDDILELLVTEFDKEELPIRRELAVQEAIIASDGRDDEARLLADLTHAGLEDSIDLLQFQGVCVFAPQTIGVSVGTEQAAFGASKDIARTALSQYTRDYRGAAIQKARLCFNKDHSNYATTYNFVGYDTDTQAAQPEVERGLADAWERTFMPTIASLKFKPGSAITPGVVALIAAIILFGMGSAMVMIGAFVLLIGLGIAGYRYYSGQQKANKAIADVRETQRNATEYSIGLYRDASAEWVDAILAYEDLDSEEEGLRNLMDNWASGKNLYKGEEEDE
ncbi:MAG: hypothetical protein LBG81_00030 [Coriobacteriaceae bacterium]|jgi:hypothetical protein|nr:hypothetical protein [Coriobacteriaceae bacterium]